MVPAAQTEAWTHTAAGRAAIIASNLVGEGSIRMPYVMHFGC